MNYYKLASEIRSIPILDQFDKQPQLHSTYSSGGRLSAPGKPVKNQPLFYRAPYMNRADLSKAELPAAAYPIPAREIPSRVSGVTIDTSKPAEANSPVGNSYQYLPRSNKVMSQQDRAGNVSRYGLYHELAHGFDPKGHPVLHNLEEEIPAMVTELASYLKNEADYVGKDSAVAQQVSGTNIPPWVYAHMMKYGPQVANNDIVQDADAIKGWMQRLRNPSDPLGSTYRTWASDPAVGPSFRVP